MIKYIFLLFFFMIQSFLSAQNLVLNPSFEETNHCITEDEVSKYSNVPSLALSQCQNWSSFSGEGTADLVQPCNQWRMQFTSQTKAHTGVAYAGFYAFDRACCDSEYREYLVGKLKTVLEQDKNYEVSFWVLLYQKSGYATSALGVYFSQDTLYRLDDFNGVAPFKPQLQNPKGKNFNNKEQWTEVHFTYKAQGGEQYLMIGNFLDDAHSDTLNLANTERRSKDAYYLIDDVCVSAQNCTMDIKLPDYGFRAMLYDASDNTPIENATVEMIASENSNDKKNTLSGNDGKARFSLSEKEYMCAVKANCYMPVFDFYEVPIVRDGKKMPEQMQYFGLVKQERGAKMLFQSDLYYTIQELQTKKSNLLPHLFLKLDKLAEYLKENSSLKISLNGGVNIDQYFSEEKKTALKQRYTANLDFMQDYLLEKSVKKEQLTTKIIELNKDHPSISGTIENSTIGRTSNRYEIEILETNCKTSEKKNDFFQNNEKGSIYILDKVFFAPDSPELEQRSFEELDKLSEFLKQNENLKIRINGHTDIGKANGSDDFLQKLSENRAKAVAEYLISKGAKKNNISWKGFANRKPIADNSTEEGKAQNRRVEVEIMQF